MVEGASGGGEMQARGISSKGGDGGRGLLCGAGSKMREELSLHTPTHCSQHRSSLPVPPMFFTWCGPVESEPPPHCSGKPPSLRPPLCLVA